MSTSTSKSKPAKLSEKEQSKHDPSIKILNVKYKFYILMFDLALAGIAIIMRIETPVVWTFLYGIGGWAALTTNARGIIR